MNIEEETLDDFERDEWIAKANRCFEENPDALETLYQAAKETWDDKWQEKWDERCDLAKGSGQKDWKMKKQKE